jgi:hypothetical protein
VPIIVDATTGVISADELASYLRNPALSSDSSFAYIVDLANGLVGDLIGTATTLPIRVKTITLEVAARAWRNPNGYSSETVDDYTYRRDPNTRQAGVYLTDDERGEILQLVGMTGGTAYSVGVPSPVDVP